MSDVANDCTDCGSAPVWWYAWSKKCKRCADKAGQWTYAEVDVDKVLAYFDGNVDKAKAFLATVWP